MQDNNQSTPEIELESVASSTQNSNEVLRQSTADPLNKTFVSVNSTLDSLNSTPTTLNSTATSTQATNSAPSLNPSFNRNSTGAGLWRKGVLLVGFLLTLELFFVGMLIFFLCDAEDSGRQEAEAEAVLLRANKLFMEMVRVSFYEKNFVGKGHKEAYVSFQEHAPIVDADMQDLIKQSRVDPLYARAVDDITPSFSRWFSTEKRLMAMQFAQDPNTSALRNSPQRLMTIDMLSKLKLVQETMKPVVEKNAAEHLQAQRSMMQWLVAGVAGNILLAILLALAFTKEITARLFIILDNTKRLSEGQALNPRLAPKDEIGQLDNVFHDMSEAVTESNRKERALIDNSREVICSLSGEGRFVKLNPAVSEKWLYEPEDLLDRKASDILLEEEREVFDSLIVTKQDSNIDLELEARLNEKNGGILDSVWAMHWSPSEDCYFAVVHDMTERKRLERAQAESEAKVRTVLDSMLIGLLTVTETGTIESANPRVEQMFQYTSADLAGRTIAEIFPDTNLGNFVTFTAGQGTGNGADSGPGSTSGTGTENRHFHIRDLSGRSKTGETVPVEAWVNEMRGENETRFLVNLVDTTARRQIEQAKEEFVAMISHDLKTPLSAVQGFLELLENGVYGSLKEKGIDRARLASRNIRSLLRLITDLLEINKLESGNIDLRKIEINVRDVVERSVEAVQGFAAKHNVSIEQSSPATLIVADGERLDRVLINLISNAAKYSPSGDKVLVQVEELADSVIFRVIDRGRGIPASHKDLVFERFKQVTTTDATQKGGAGLGLAICKAIVEQHGGNIGVDSIEGEGSTFWFKVPKNHPAEKAANN